VGWSVDYSEVAPWGVGLGGALEPCALGSDGKGLEGEIQPGSKVRVRDADGEDEYTLVRSGKAHPAKGRISAESPVGRALLGGRRGDEVKVQTPGGIRALTIVDVAAPRCCSSEE
jgi:transcription elongation GreA/GreB family factor